MKRLELTFRATFLGALITLVASTGFLIGASSYWHASFTALDLSNQLVDQTGARVDEQVQKLVTTAVQVGALQRRLLESGLYSPRDFERLVPYLREVMTVERQLTGVFVGAEATGESTGVSRLNGRLSVWQSNRNHTTGLLDQRDFWPDDYPAKAYAFDPQKPAPDIRTRPWYVLAREAKRPRWTDTYPFLGVNGVGDAHGVTYAAPVYGARGELQGVLDVDFELRQLSTFLQSLRIARTGYAFVVERRTDGSNRLIAHPDLRLLAEGRSGAEGLIADGRVRALVEASPDGAGPSVLRFEDGGARYIGGYRALSGNDPPPWRIGVVLPEAEVLERVDRSNRTSAAIALGGLVLALVCGVYVARQVARPLEQLAREMGAIAELELEARPVKHSIVAEVDRVANAVEDIKTSLRQKRVLEKYVPKGARTDIERNRGGNVALGGARVRKAILFSDLRGFTAMSERLEPDAVVRLLNAYLEAMTSEILEHGGDINEYIGDAILAVFEDATKAVDAATSMQRALRELAERSDDADLRSLRMGIGVHVGDVVEGNIGTVERVKFGVVGDTVNLAARIQDRSREGKFTCVFVSEAVSGEAAARWELALVGDLAMKGKAQSARVFEVVGPRGAEASGAP